MRPSSGRSNRECAERLNGERGVPGKGPRRTLLMSGGVRGGPFFVEENRTPRGTNVVRPSSGRSNRECAERPKGERGVPGKGPRRTLLISGGPEGGPFFVEESRTPRGTSVVRPSGDGARGPEIWEKPPLEVYFPTRLWKFRKMTPIWLKFPSHLQWEGRYYTL